jgi:putative methyltransferase
MKADRLRVWLADLGHEEVVRVRVVPLGIGYLASALQSVLGDRVETRLFTQGGDVISALEKDLPDVIGVSNYIWNHSLSLRILELVKERQPDLLSVMGGPHIRIEPDELREFLLKHPYVDAYVPQEAEGGMCALIERCLNVGTRLDRLGSIPGCYLNIPEYDFKRANGKYTINQYGSPYLKGILDKYLEDPAFFPLLESNRGCPYACTFCAWGAAVGTRIVKKDTPVNEAEAEYIAQKSAQDLWYFADGNFGIFKEDLDFAYKLKDLKDRYGHPKKVSFHTAKNNAERVLTISQVLKDMAPINIAVQSTDEVVLAHMKRKNLKEEDIRHFVNVHHKEGRAVHTDLLFPSPSETLESHIDSIRTCVDIGYDYINIGHLRMLPGTEMDSDKSRLTYKLRTKWRPLDIGWGFYGEQFVFEKDENIISTSTMSEEEVYGLKKLHFLMYLLWNFGLGKPLLTLSAKCGVNPVDVMLALAMDQQSALSRRVLTPICDNFRSEFFESEEQLIRYYSQPEVTQDILAGRRDFQKLNLKYVAHCIDEKSIILDTIQQMRVIIQREATIDPELLDVVTSMTQDRTRLDIFPGPLNKQASYQISRPLFQRLQDLEVLDRSVPYQGKGFELTYEFSADNEAMLKGLLNRFNYQQNPSRALYGVLVTCDVGTFFTYKVAMSAAVPTVR